MKPRTGDGPMEVTKEARSLVMRIPLEGGGRLVVEMNAEEANNLSAALHAAVALVKKYFLFQGTSLTNHVSITNRRSARYKSGFIG